MPKIAYLFGAGASEGELKQRGALKSILMDGIREGIISKLSKEPDPSLEDVSNDLSADANIEQLITLYEASGTREHIEVARRLKGLFRKELQERVRESGDSFLAALFAPLLDMHSLPSLDEQLVVILTTNYEDLIEQAMQAVNGGINYLIKTVPSDAQYVLNDRDVPILKLHGSFNWKNKSPVVVQKAIEDEEDVIWIPPGVAKKREYYPFDLIWSKARELLDCDVLRIIGSSLSMNDWELVSLVHTTQKLRTDQKPPYAIEVIDYPRQCTQIKDQHKYLNIRTILEIPEVRDYLVRMYLPAYIGGSVADERLEEIAAYLTPPENMFALWLRAKGEALYYNDRPIATAKGYFEKFVLAGLV